MKRTMFSLGGLLALATALSASPARAQFYGGLGLGGLGLGWGFPYYGAGSTPPGDFLHGVGSAAAGTGQAVLQGSMAAVNGQVAYQKFLENLRNTEATYYDIKRMNASYRDSLRRPPPSMEEVREYNRSRIPPRLTEDQFNEHTGEINWPLLLRNEAFAPQRRELDRLFAERSKYTSDAGPGTANYHDISRIVQEMHDVLLLVNDELTPTELLIGHKFLRSLAFEGRFAPGEVPDRDR